jgi:excisionase family DNA binding protein
LDFLDTPELVSACDAISVLVKKFHGVPMADSSRKPVDSEFASIPPFEPLLDSDEAAALLRIHPKTLQKMARTGEIAGVQVGKLWRFRGSELDQWLRSKLAS